MPDPRAKPVPDFSLEAEYDGRVAGVDEVGRGPWAGPVVAAAVIFRDYKPVSGLMDSKLLSASKRAVLKQEIESRALIGIGLATVSEIDQINILQATFLAMKRAIGNLPELPDIALIDGNRVPKGLICPAQTVIKGDQKSMSIAAASVVAKQYRDALMQRLALQYPGYGWETNAGYGTKKHQEGLSKFGVTPEHRRSFLPIKRLLE